MEMGSRIAELRKRRGLNQSELGRAVGLTPQSVQAWEKGGGIRPDKFAPLAAALGVSLPELLLGDGYAPSQAARLDADKIAAAIDAINKALAREPGMRLDLSTPEDAEIFAAVYALRVQEPGMSDVEFGMEVATIFQRDRGLNERAEREATGTVDRGEAAATGKFRDAAARRRRP